ncbi:DUF4926 domain-containing protein [Myxosarcina sp. GI1]|uniref:DUF4926 domain-containing protein n=1 Tax=Myxosarcina sp. GI1 TaxID=1541065 RepID=UPI00055EDD24|nr:DUF4926 domain-containing protein [Myxosarcina sp. GI1]
MSQIKEYDLVTIDRDILTTHKETNEPILLRKGQVGTAVMDFDGKAFLIDFADEQGVTYAMETVPAEQLIPLLYKPVALQAS